MKVFEALSDDTRLAILDELAAGDRTAGELAELFPVTRPAVSRHLRVLREAGLVTARQEAQRRIYTIDGGPLREVDKWLDRYRKFWQRRLEGLADFIEEEGEGG
jgi:DNA-binding transcriptional ArsR family regulator